MVAVVTGAARGLGLGLVRALLERGDDVVAACRSPSPELAAASGAHVVAGIDLARDESVPRLTEALGERRVDLVVCNAGLNVSFDAGVVELDAASAAAEYEVNALGAARTVQAALPRLRAGSRIVLLTTGPNALSPRPAVAGNYGYRMSKAALNVFGYQLAVELAPRGILVRLVAPGPVATDMLRAVSVAGRTTADATGAPDPLVVARDLLARADEVTPETSGAWVGRDGTRLHESSPGHR